MLPYGIFFASVPNPEMALLGELQRDGVRILYGRRGLRVRRNLAVHPIQDRLQHFAIVFLYHHHVAVAVDAVLRQPQFFGRASGLLQERERARSAGRCERRFGRDQHDRNAPQVFQFARGLFLNLVRTQRPARVKASPWSSIPTDPSPADRRSSGSS